MKIMGMLFTITATLLGGYYAYAVSNASVQPTNYVRGMVVPHHLLAEKLIQEAFTRIASQAPSVVVLLSPNHFAAGKGPFIATNRVWNASTEKALAPAKLHHDLAARRGES